MEKSDRDISQWDARLKQQLERSFHNYHKRRIDLSIARDNKQFDWTGETLIVEKASSSSAIATVRLMFEDADPLTLEENVEIESIFNRLYLSNDTQAGAWLDVIAGINFKYKKKIAEGHKYVDRGDPANADFDKNDLTTDDTWRELDLSSIVPISAVSVVFNVIAKQDVAGNVIMFRKKGNTNQENLGALYIQTSIVYVSTEITISLGGDAIIEYNASSVTWDTLNITIRGWLI